jgi:aerobic-type carbon monoxide dehydrogenase small subunit (CoxS/CutS family)
LQCGYCTSGMIMTGVGLLSKNAHPSKEEIVRSMDRNMCRCGTYARIVNAIELASASMKEGRR